MSQILSLNQLLATDFKRWEQGTAYSGYEQPLAEVWGAKYLGFHLESLDPGRFSCPYHRHTAEEELFLVLKGSAILRQEDSYRRVVEKDLIFFKTGVAHHFYNDGDEPFLFLALSNVDSSDVCEYPDSRKTMERSTRKIYQDGKEIEDYWAGEEDPKHFWPEAWLKKS